MGRPASEIEREGALLRGPAARTQCCPGDTRSQSRRPRPSSRSCLAPSSAGIAPTLLRSLGRHRCPTLDWPCRETQAHTCTAGRRAAEDQPGAFRWADGRSAAHGPAGARSALALLEEGLCARDVVRSDLVAACLPGQERDVGPNGAGGAARVLGVLAPLPAIVAQALLARAAELAPARHRCARARKAWLRAHEVVDSAHPCGEGAGTTFRWAWSV